MILFWQGGATPPNVTISGGTTIGAPSLAGQVKEAQRVSGSTTIAGPAFAGQAREVMRVAGGAILAGPALAGQAVERLRVSGGTVLGAPQLSGAATERVELSGGATIGGPALDGATGERFTLAGVVFLGGPSLAGGVQQAAAAVRVQGGVTLGLALGGQLYTGIQTPPAITGRSRRSTRWVRDDEILKSRRPAIRVAGGVQIGSPRLGGTADVNDDELALALLV